ncbi:MAG: carbamoyltransferase HypF [Actinomycetota bacterium]|nr:carbamoyltransferase HypF [Actinomycetota bacterium]
MLNYKSKDIKTYDINISGIVQGVGFRPFISRLAHKYKLKGNVSNTTEGVTVKINSSDIGIVNKFISDIKNLKPPAAVIEELNIKEADLKNYKSFKIVKSKETEEKFQLVSPDIATCRLCQKDINNKKDLRRYYYPFTNCTSCGPRFTIIKKMPYDRPNTTMKNFKMCSDCMEEYEDTGNRRFHAQPNACRKCGPELFLTDKNGKMADLKNPIISASELLNDNKIIAIKSLGGFQIACSALSDKTVSILRKRKNRPVKPFAVMFKNIHSIKKYYHIGTLEAESLMSSRAPIVLVRKKTENYPLSRQVSMYNGYEGVMLPYTPIHHLLFNNVDVPLIMTSGNLSEEPIASENNEALGRLRNICDYFLMHNRDIYSRYDDSVIRIFNGKEMMIRRARGYAPYPVKLDRDTGKKVIFSAGAHNKNNFCFLVKNYAIVSQHIGDLDDPESIKFYNSAFRHYGKLFNIESIDTAACDKHPLYASTRFTKSIKIVSKNIKVQHHKAHIASVIAENKVSDRIIGFAWDGTGYGDDGKIWGSEIFIVNRDLNFKRAGHLLEKPLPGGEITIKKPYRMAVCYLYNLWKENNVTHDGDSNFPQFLYKYFPFYKKIISTAEIDIITRQIGTGFNSPVTTSMGRLFDAVSSVLNYTHISSYEGEAAVRLEMAAGQKNKSRYKIKITGSYNSSNYIIDDYYIFSQIIDDITGNIPHDIISSKFHLTLAYIILEISRRIRENSRIDRIALSGGVFQNNYLMNNCFSLLKKNNFKVYSNFKVPVNDGGISLGQAYIAARKLRL